MKDAVWQAFARTGDPVYYLLYKQLDKDIKPDRKSYDGTGTVPRPED